MIPPAFGEVAISKSNNLTFNKQQHHTMSSEEPANPMAESGVTVRSDSEQYSGTEEPSMSPPSSGPAMILYQPPTLWGLVRGAAINLLLPFINGMMLGFGELFAHEAAFRLGWGGTRVRGLFYALVGRAEARHDYGVKGRFLLGSLLTFS